MIREIIQYGPPVLGSPVTEVGQDIRLSAVGKVSMENRLKRQWEEKPRS